jgi:predicted heme/steroid binding protein
MSTTKEKTTQTESLSKTFTRAELAKYDGKTGASGYIAINGIVYDVTNFQLLKDGKHHGVVPGNDVSHLFVHKNGILNRLKVVGKLA